MLKYQTSGNYKLIEFRFRHIEMTGLQVLPTSSFSSDWFHASPKRSTERRCGSGVSLSKVTKGSTVFGIAETNGWPDVKGQRVGGRNTCEHCVLFMRSLHRYIGTFAVNWNIDENVTCFSSGTLGIKGFGELFLGSTPPGWRWGFRNWTPGCLGGSSQDGSTDTWLYSNPHFLSHKFRPFEQGPITPKIGDLLY